MQRLEISALVAGAAAVAVSLADAAWRATQDTLPAWDESRAGLSFADLVLVVPLIAAYATGAAVLVRHARDIDVNAVARWSRRLLAVALTVLAVAFLAMLLDSSGEEPTGPVAVLFGISFALTFLLPVVLGLALVRRARFRSAALVLASPLVVIPVTVLAAAVSEWGHPAYAEVAALLGVPLLGLTAERDVEHHAGAVLPVADG